MSPRSRVWIRGYLRNWSFVMLIVGLAGHAALAQDATRERDRAPSPSRVTLSTAGLAEYVFAFPVENEATVRLVLETADVDDVLKSLVVRDPAGSGHKVSLPSEWASPRGVALPLFAWIMPQGERAGGAGRSWRDRTSDA